MKRLLVANRGEIALRIMRTARAMGLQTAAVYSDADADAPHVRAADVAERIGPGPATESYLSIDAVLRAAKATGSDAVHPGYGFLAESPEFAECCVGAGLTFVGPPASAMRALGNKSSAKRLLEGSGVPFVPGYHGANQDDDVLARAARDVGFPVMIKASAGGGGRGMRLVASEAHFSQALRSARAEALAAFGSGDVLLERALIAPRHVEVQIFADTFGNVVHLGERDCSVQRRHQKLIEEAPSPAVDDALRERLGAVAVTVARATQYVGAGTVEFLLDASGSFWFIEVNTRLQVEHPVTEAITGLDLVEWQLRIASGERLPREQRDIRFDGHAIEARICAEDPARDFLPQTGTLVAWVPPAGLRNEHALESGMIISPYYDSMIAKAISSDATRDAARDQLIDGLERCVALGIPTNIPALLAILRDDVFAAGSATTAFIEERLDLTPFAATPSPRSIALGAALQYVLEAKRGKFGSLTAWSSSPGFGSVLRISVDANEPLDVAIHPNDPFDVAVSFGTESSHVAFADLGRVPGRVRVRIDDEPWRFVDYAQSAAGTYVAFDGRSYTVVDRSADRADTAAGGAGDGLLRAPMSGRVASVARSGDVAKAGSPLATLEAMKMEHILTLPVDVVLGEITAVIGAQVHANDVLLAYEPAVP